MSSTIPSSRFYVYVLARPNGNPFYVGKGKNDRVYDHECEARRGCRCHKCNVIRKIWRNGGQVQRYIVLETEDEQEALDHEASLIDMYGLETLTNQQSGGSKAFTYSNAQRAQISKRMRAYYQNPENRQRTSVSMKRVYASGLSAEQRMRVKRIASLGGKRVRTPEERAARSAFMKARYADPVYRARMAELARQRPANATNFKFRDRAQLSAWGKERGRSEQTKAHLANLARNMTPEQYRKGVETRAKIHATRPKVLCPECGKPFSIYGIVNHRRMTHGVIREAPCGDSDKR